MRISTLLLTYFFAALSSALAEPRHSTFTLSLRGPCGQTLEAPAGSLYDDGTGGAPDFVNDRPGHVWDLVLTRESVAGRDQRPCAWWWTWGVGVEGPVRITDISSVGTVACFTHEGPGCFAQGAFADATLELTGLPFGVGPQTEANHGAIGSFRAGLEMPGLCFDAEYLIARIRVVGYFPEREGETARCRVFLAPRTGSRGIDEPVEIVTAFGDSVISLTEGCPPLVVEDCEFFLRAAPPAADVLRCDANADARLEISDAVAILQFLFSGGDADVCTEALDCDGDGERNITDAVYGLSFLFLGGAPPPEPFPACGRVEGLTSTQCPPGSTSCL